MTKETLASAASFATVKDVVTHYQETGEVPDGFDFLDSEGTIDLGLLEIQLAAAARARQQLG
ncbi:MAG: hypothetical protein EOO15_21525 [Chitinophagaceae bacterium]|nr:MAG: hypothetical protein EOO15_21525 [Chitinophagaceae bacterium]